MKRMYNEITDCLNEYLTDGWKKSVDESDTLGTYILNDSYANEFGEYAIRFPGATRGHISIDSKGVITDIVIQEPEKVKVYSLSNEELTSLLRKKFIGYTLDINS